MALLSVIRRWYFRERKSIREISRRTGLSRNTVRKYLRGNIVEPSYSNRHYPRNLDSYAQTLTEWLTRETRRHRKQRRSVKQLYYDLIALGYRGSYDRVAAFARDWRSRQREAAQHSGKGTYVPLVFKPGEAFQFDWSEDYVVINGQSTKLQIAQFKLSYSRAFYLRAYMTQTHEMLFDAHNHAFRAFGGVPARGIYDNMKTAVDKVSRGKHRHINTRFQAMVSHYLFEADFCNPAAGWEKGQIEKTVRDSRHRLWHQAPTFRDLDEVNAWLQTRCRALWDELDHPTCTGTIAQRWAEEVPQLMAVTAPFDGYVAITKRVSSTCLINVERNRYSVPASFANRPVSVHVYCDQLVIVAEGHEVARHQRVFSRDHSAPGKTIYDWRHYLSVIQRKPGALRNGAPFAELPQSFKQLQKRLLKRPGGDREMVDILALVLHHNEHHVEQAIRMALDCGECSKQHVLNCLSRLLGSPKPAAVEPPPRLRLVTEPQANLDRYDELREKRHVR